MRNFKFASVPSHSSVVAGVTVLASAWFLVAAGTIVADPTAPSLRVDPPREELTVGVTEVPEIREKILVTASRSATL